MCEWMWWLTFMVSLEQSDHLVHILSWNYDQLLCAFRPLWNKKCFISKIGNGLQGKEHLVMKPFLKNASIHLMPMWKENRWILNKQVDKWMGEEKHFYTRRVYNLMLTYSEIVVLFWYLVDIVASLSLILNLRLAVLLIRKTLSTATKSDDVMKK